MPTLDYPLRNDKQTYQRLNDNEKEMFEDFQRRINESMSYKVNQNGASQRNTSNRLR